MASISLLELISGYLFVYLIEFTAAKATAFGIPKGFMFDEKSIISSSLQPAIREAV
jgi:hypothetical protein